MAAAKKAVPLSDGILKESVPSPPERLVDWYWSDPSGEMRQSLWLYSQRAKERYPRYNTLVRTRSPTRLSLGLLNE